MYTKPSTYGDNTVLWKAMEERGVSEGIRMRIEEIYRETRSRVRVYEEVGECFLDSERSKTRMPTELVSCFIC